MLVRTGRARVGVTAITLASAAVGLNTDTAAARFQPSAPRSVTAYPATGSVKITWRPPLSAGVRKVDRYKVFRWATGVPKRASTVAARKRSLTINGLEPGKRYTFQVLAHNARGWGKPSRTVTAVPLRASGPAPAPTPKGFGTIAGPCGLVAPQLDDATPSLFRNRFDFHDDPYDDPEDRPLLTTGAQTIASSPNAGGSSTNSEVFAFETLARCEDASLVKLGTEIVYDQAGTTTDLLVQIGGSRVGVMVTRAVGFPADAPYTQQASTLLTQKLNDIRESSQHVAAADAWAKQVLVVMAYADMHGDAIEAAWLALDANTKGDTIVYVIVTDGSDQPVYFT